MQKTVPVNKNTSLVATIPFDEFRATLCVACCTTSSMPHDTVRDVAAAIEAFATLRMVLLCESPVHSSEGEEVIVVPPGTKLSKVRRLANVVESDFFLLCDPDFSVSGEGCRALVRRTLDEALRYDAVVAFGVVEGKDDGTLLSRVIAVDKWLSHRILRPSLWFTGIGITLPGQLLLVSSSLLRSLDPTVDTYLDDLYLGWLARRNHVRVLRLATVVGVEDPRSSWVSLLTQRVRWMKGIASLSRHLSRHPSALVLIKIHYLVYHGIPILWLVLVVLLGCVNFLASVGVVICLATVISVLSGRSILACVTFLGVFPLVHIIATLIWWLPITRSTLTKR